MKDIKQDKNIHVIMKLRVGRNYGSKNKTRKKQETSSNDKKSFYEYFLMMRISLVSGIIGILTKALIRMKQKLFTQ